MWREVCDTHSNIFPSWSTSDSPQNKGLTKENVNESYWTEADLSHTVDSFAYSHVSFISAVWLYNYSITIIILKKAIALMHKSFYVSWATSSRNVSFTTVDGAAFHRAELHRFFTDLGNWKDQISSIPFRLSKKGYQTTLLLDQHIWPQADKLIR